MNSIDHVIMADIFMSSWLLSWPLHHLVGKKISAEWFRFHCAIAAINHFSRWQFVCMVNTGFYVAKLRQLFLPSLLKQLNRSVWALSRDTLMNDDRTCIAAMLASTVTQMILLSWNQACRWPLFVISVTSLSPSSSSSPSFTSWSWWAGTCKPPASSSWWLLPGSLLPACRGSPGWYCWWWTWWWWWLPSLS